MSSYKMQAVSSSDGLLKTWLASSPDFAAAGFPGPGSALNIAVVDASNDSGFPTQRQIARMLTAPTKKHHLFVISDSTQTQMQTYALTHCPEIAWSGSLTTYSNGLAAAGAHTATAATGGTNDKVWDSPKIGGRTFWFGTIPSVEVEFLGGAEPSGNATLSRTQYSYALVNQANCPLLWTGLGTKGAAIRSLVYRYGSGMSGAPGLMISHRGNNSAINLGDAGNFQGASILNTRREGALTEISVALAAPYAWATYSDPSFEVIATQGGSTVNTEKVAVTTPWVEADGPGVIYFPLSLGGWSLKGWLNTHEIPMTFWTEVLPSIAANPIFFIDLGVNGTITQALHEERLERLVARCRTAFPTAPFILGTEHEFSGSGSSPAMRLGTIAVAARTPGCLLLDTMAEMGTYAAGVTAGYYGDTIHYDADGLTAYWAKLGDMIALAAA